jgi:stage IV sporulation protein A
MAGIKEEYEKIMHALNEAREGGYGIVMPTKGELRITEPETVRRGSSYGVRIGAEAEALHIIKTRIAADICPSFGTQEQADEAARAMKAEFDAEPDSLLDTKLFGRSLYELVNDGMHDKLTHMPREARAKMGQTIEKIINEGASGLICILV